jgi:hypothetical protein
MGGRDAADIVFRGATAEEEDDMNTVEPGVVHGRRLYLRTCRWISSRGEVCVVVRTLGTHVAAGTTLTTCSHREGMGMTSDDLYAPQPLFLTHHALRIKGFAKSESLADITALDVDLIERRLEELARSGHALYREARSLWQLTPEGREAHREALERDVRSLAIDALEPHYRSFLDVNEVFKSLCGEWQVRHGQPNDHSDPGYDASVIERLVLLNRHAQPIVTSMAGVVPRLSPYASRLESACRNVSAGSHHLFTGVMCGSFHDIWMELHEDLILTQGIDRAAEGSF